MTFQEMSAMAMAERLRAVARKIDTLEARIWSGWAGAHAVESMLPPLDWSAERLQAKIDDLSTKLARD